MQYDAFSRNVHQVLELATALATRYGCGYIGSEHILFGLANVKDGRSQSILRAAGYDNARYLQLFSKTVEHGVTLPGNMLTPRTKQLFDKALEISLKAHSGIVGTEHLLLAVLLSIDSKYVLEGVTKYLPTWLKNNWSKSDKKPVLNQDLWKELVPELNRHQIEWIWVKGHAGHPENERADALACQERDKYKFNNAAE